MAIAYVKRYDVHMCRRYPRAIFVFGDNLIGQGMAGQAAIRREPNSFGVPTKALPSMDDNAFFNDDSDACRGEVVRALHQIETFLTQRRVVVLPTDGLGTGLAELPTRAPKLFAYLSGRLELMTNLFGVVDLATGQAVTQKEFADAEA